jgi:hypothetical protein
MFLGNSNEMLCIVRKQTDGLYKIELRKPITICCFFRSKYFYSKEEIFNLTAEQVRNYEVPFCRIDSVTIDIYPKRIFTT